METVTFPGRYESLAEIASYIRQAATQAGLDSLAQYQVETAVDEACTNIIEYAYKGENRGDIECTCVVSEGELTVILVDHGNAFNPNEIPVPDINAPLKDRNTQGLGLYIMRQWMDEVHFEFTSDCGNVLRMVKRKEKKPC